VSILIVRKTTNYELHGKAVEARVKEGLIPSSTLVRLTDAHREHHACLNEVRAILTKHQVPYEEISREQGKGLDSSLFERVITVGGDGTLLAASHILPHTKPVLGIRSSASSVGYLCGGSFDSLEPNLLEFLDGKSELQRLQRLKAVVTRVASQEKFSSVPVLNDLLYTNASPAATTRYLLTHNKRKEAHRSSGIWIATAAGSTAGLFAAGGKRSAPSDLNYQYRVRELYKLGLTNPKLEGDFFSPEKDVFHISNRCEHAILAFDGQHGEINLEYGDEVDFARAEPLDVVKNPRLK
jgi:NAD+ kinase